MKTQSFEEAIQDARQANKIDPSNQAIRDHWTAI
jgi:hypothetical protein